MDSRKELLLKNVSAKDYSFFMIHNSDLASFNAIKKHVLSMADDESMNIQTIKKFINMIKDPEYAAYEEIPDAIQFTYTMTTFFQDNSKFKKYYFPSNSVLPENVTDIDAITDSESLMSIIKDSRGFFDMVIQAIFKVIHHSANSVRTEITCKRMLLFALMEYRDHEMSEELRKKYHFNGKYAVCFIAGYITHHFFKKNILSDAEVNLRKPKPYYDKVKKHYNIVRKIAEASTKIT